jgi:hypothetical protein
MAGVRVREFIVGNEGKGLFVAEGAKIGYGEGDDH